MRRERTHLQHEAEILNQKTTQELLTLKDELKGMFDDRKMGVRSEQREMESKVRCSFIKPLLSSLCQLATHFKPLSEPGICSVSTADKT